MDEDFILIFLGLFILFFAIFRWNWIENHYKVRLTYQQLGKKYVPKTAEYVFTHAEFHLEAEYKWLNSLLENYSQPE